MGVSHLNRAKKNKNDEFYTERKDIENELQHYTKHFKNKVVYCNCDDPKQSEFFKYFSSYFEVLGLKKLITSCYKNSDGTFFSQGKSEQAVYLEYEGDRNGNKIVDPKELEIKKFKSDGDFRSQESIDLLKQADIVVTNPPFSLFREYIEQLIKHKKKFLVVGNMNSIYCKDIFPLIKDNKIWLGTQRIGKFKNSKGNIENVSGCWYTNLKHNIRNEELCLTKKYNPKIYPKYDNYNAINVDKTKEIPKNYNGIMGVPISFLTKYNPNQFEIIGLGQGNLFKQISNNGLSKNFVDNYYKQGNTGKVKINHPMLGYYDLNKKTIIPYSRILIRNKTL